MATAKQIRDRQRATAASETITIGGREFQMSPLTDKDIAELDSFVQQRSIQIARDSVAGQSDEIRRETIAIAIECALGLTWMAGRGAKILATVPGMARLLWQSVKRNHPEITVDELQELMLERNNIETVTDTFKKLNNSAEAQGKKVPRIVTNPTSVV